MLNLSPPTNVDNTSTDEGSHVKMAAKEAEGYLLTLAVRALWRSSNHTEAYDLSIKGLAIMDTHLKEMEGKLSSSSTGGMQWYGGLYPLRSRMIRYQCLVGESLGVRSTDLAGRYRNAVLVKDGDGICTVLNLMLRELLLGDQGECVYFRCC